MKLTMWTPPKSIDDAQHEMRNALLELEKGDGLVYHVGNHIPEQKDNSTVNHICRIAWTLGTSRYATLVQQQLGPVSDRKRHAYYILQRK